MPHEINVITRKSSIAANFRLGLIKKIDSALEKFLLNGYQGIITISPLKEKKMIWYTPYTGFLKIAIIPATKINQAITGNPGFVRIIEYPTYKVMRTLPPNKNQKSLDWRD
jgi:hypothetical protein